MVRTMKEVIDVPVPRGRGRGRLQGSLPMRSSTAAGAVQSVDIPVRGGHHGFLPRQRSTQRPVSSSSLTVLLEVIKIVTSVRAQQLHPLALRMRLVQEVLSHVSPNVKKVRHFLRNLGRNCLRTQAHGRRQLMPCRRTLRRRRKEKEEEEDEEEEVTPDSPTWS